MSSITFAQQDSIVEAVILDSADIAADIAYNTGVSDLEQKKYKNAVDNFTKAITLKDSFELAFYNRGLAYYSLESFQDALNDFNKSIELNPKAETYFKKGETQEKMNNLTDAIYSYDMAISLDGSHHRAFL